MADTDIAHMSVEELNEELTIQNVILDSLQDQTYEGVEEMREDARHEIDRLKKRMHSLKQKKHPSPPPYEQYSLSPGWLALLPNYLLSEYFYTPFMQTLDTNLAPQEFRQPTEHRDMSTPTKNNTKLDEIGSFSLPNRKRGVDLARLSPHEGQLKARRTTPAPFGDPFSTASAHDSLGDGQIDYIDLTGDDDDDDEFGSGFVAEQIKAENRQKQESADLKYARMLSSQGSPGPNTARLSPHANAFTRLMNSQRPGNRRLGKEDASDFSPGPSSLSPVPKTEGAHQHVPGAYNTSWDDPSSQGPVSQPHAFNFTAPGNGASSSASLAPSHAPYGSHGSGSFTPEDLGIQFAGAVAAANAARLGLPHPGALHVAPPPRMSRNHHQASGHMPGHPSRDFPWPSFAGPSSSSRPLPPPGSHGTSGLSDIIRRTNNFDYSSGLDMYGNPMSEQLTDILQDAYHDPRVSEKDLENLLQNIRPDMDIPEADRGGTPAGLKRPLYPHQEVALTWMKKMEEGTNKGGVLADDMGLGKTISTLALMLSRPATTRPKTNLIVGPVALIRQWEEEIQTKTKLSHRLSVFVYHNKKTTTDELLNYDVVLTTYGTIAQELKRLDKYIEENADRNIDYSDKTFLMKCPLLHPRKAHFYRIILDEAQCIKNKDTRTAKACTRLRATYRWCLTGTPMMNGVLELYSLLNFLQIKPYCKWEQFRQSFGVLFGRNGDPKSVAMDRLRALLKAIMLRRKKNSQLDGKPILKLPEKNEEIVYAEMSSEERDFYDQLEKKSQVQFSKYLRAGSIGKNYSNILVLLLRLRQACCHPHLNLDVDDANPTSISDEEKMELVKELDVAIVERIKDIDAFECPICYDAVQCPSFFVPCGHDSCGECLVRLAENAATVNLQEGNESNRAKCPVCRGPFDPSKCFSYETFQKVHMPERIKQATPDKEEGEDEVDSDEDESETDDSSDDDVDNKGNLKDFIVNDEFSDLEESKPARKTKKKGKGKANGKGKRKAADIKPSMLKTLRKEAYKNRDAFKKYMRYLRKTWEPAAKVTECMNLLKQIRETGEKTIIFSQWTLLLDLLEVAMHHEKLDKPERYDGSMTATQRNTSAHNFRDRKDVKVMLVSLRAGNAGLNLTAASRVIIMDPFWNPYIEMQAVDRAYRIGQQKEVKVYRILTKDTVEDRIVALQNRKKEIVEAALDEAESVKIARLSGDELKYLFFAR
ncbi:hypothetical protein FZEAL_7079 [Fusarium zealandicum]|uniref:ATP-dependent helicase n=1 Tax=Fusarium zealandicum TaxID=1053134 RepID=A0A8H4UHI5_9HYPO|nr:hypothetical protein FZEAL_7079 [Fusarium zealandicum]